MTPHRTFLPHRLRLTVLAFVAATSGPLTAFAQPTPAECGDLRNAYGPHDYRRVRGVELDLVEHGHFTPQVEALIRGQGGYIDGDLDYTLRAFPNHHRALLSMMRMGERMKLARLPHANYSVECYFERALRFQPDDTTARMLYVLYLSRNGRRPEATRQLQLTDQRARDNGFTQFNIGLSYFDLQDYDNALKHAHKAIELGFTRTELKERLRAAGKWREPSPSAVAASASAAAPGEPTQPIDTAAGAAGEAASAR